MSIREALENACESGNLQQVDEILKRVQYEAYYRKKAFRKALHLEQMEILKSLVEKVGIGDLWENGEGMVIAEIIVMHISNRNNVKTHTFLLDVIRYFLEERGIDINSVPVTNETNPRYAIDIAALRGAEDVVNLLLEYGAIVHPVGIMISCVNDYMELSKLLVSYATPKVINEALTLCSCRCNVISSYFPMEISRVLLDYGADPSYITKGNTQNLQKLREYIPFNPRRVLLCCS